jgi:hypothetical protein
VEVVVDDVGIRQYEDQRINMFKAFAELREEGYDIPASRHSGEN